METKRTSETPNPILTSAGSTHHRGRRWQKGAKAKGPWRRTGKRHPTSETERGNRQATGRETHRGPRKWRRSGGVPRDARGSGCHRIGTRSGGGGADRGAAVPPDGGARGAGGGGGERSRRRPKRRAEGGPAARPGEPRHAGASRPSLFPSGEEGKLGVLSAPLPLLAHEHPYNEVIVYPEREPIVTGRGEYTRSGNQS
eukprot:9468586-Pyramimonas_sp.AAC.1